MSGMRLPGSYQKLFAASALSNLGNGVSAVAYPWIASSVTRSPLLLSLIGLMATMPWLVFSLPAGVFIDRFPRRSVIVFTDVLRGVVTLVVAFSIWGNESSIHVVRSITKLTVIHTHLGLYLLLLFATFLLGCGEVLGNGASQTFIPLIVETEQLETANGRMWTSESLMQNFMGPPLASVLLGLSVFAPLVFDGASFFASAGLIALIASSMIKKQKISEVKPDFRAELKEGLSWLWRHPFLRPLAFILGSINGLNALGFSVFILFAQENLHTSVLTFGLLSTGGAFGGALGGVLAGRIIKRFGRAFILKTVLLGSPIFLVAMAFSPIWELVWLISAIEMFFAILWNVVTVSMRQEIIPDQILGRVNSVYRFFALGSQPIGALIGGVLVTISLHLFTRSFALRAPMLVGAILGLIVAYFALPHLSQTKIDEARGKGDKD
ncbi:MAG: MFS transporter [Actinomycetes bacterium]